jgi:hypothetical protein
MTRTILLSAALAAVLAGAAEAQTAADSGRFIIRHGRDTVAVETFGRHDVNLVSTLEIPKAGKSETFSATIAPDGTIPLVEVIVKEDAPTVIPAGVDSTKFPKTTPRIVQRARAIFKNDSVAVDAMRDNGLDTRIFGTQAGALPYVNLSFSLLEQALRRASAAGGQVPFFNLAGSSTLVATVTRAGADSAQMKLGDVQIDFRLDPQSRILGARIASQDVSVERQ